MEDLGDIKIFRRNIMLVSLLTIIFIFFKWDIININILWVIKTNNVNDFKLIIILIILNFYVFLRYYTYIKSIYIIRNYAKLFKELLNNYNKDLIEISNDSWKIKAKIDSFWNLLVNNDKYENIDNIYSNKYSWLYIDFRDSSKEEKIVVYPMNQWPNFIHHYWISIYYKRSFEYYLRFLKVIFIDHYYFNYYLPLVINIVAILLLLNELI